MLKYFKINHRVVVKNYYFDHMASTACHPEVIALMRTYLTQDQFCANPSSTHRDGQRCAAEIENFSKRFLQVLGQAHGEIVWTSGATEAINLAILGACRQYKQAGKHVISLKTEHNATLAPLKQLEKEGFEVTLLDVEKNGQLDYDNLVTALRDDTIMVSVMHVHNEIGIVQNIKQIADLCHQHGIMLHVDCAQTLGKTSAQILDNVTFASYSGHKCSGPNGVGALYMQAHPPRNIKSILLGGTQQKQRRAGTLPLFLIAGFVCAAEIAQTQLDSHKSHYLKIHQVFREQLNKSIRWNNTMTHSVLQNIHITLPAQVCLKSLEALKFKFCISSQSACHASAYSHVLSALGMSLDEQKRSLRIALGSTTTITAAESLISALNQLI